MFESLAHLFTPRISNNQRPRILHPAGLSVLVGLFLLSQVFLEFVKVSGGIDGLVLGYASSISPSQVVEQTNAQRGAQGLTPLTVNAALNQAAIGKANDMFAKQYWAHVSPDGLTPWVFIKNAGYNYNVAGENLARDFGDTGSMMSAWMASPTHKANIVNGKYSEIGVAVVDGIFNGVETTLVVQMFGSQGSVVAATPPQAAATEPAPAVVSEPVAEEKLAVVPIVEEVADEPVVEIPPSVTVLSKATGNETAYTIISPLTLTKAIATAIVMLIIAVLVYDAFVASKRKTVRLVGKNWAHFSFFAVLAVIIYTITQGVVI
jgi:uncharacterized protein YkwD